MGTIKSYTRKYSLDIDCAVPNIAARYGGIYAIQNKKTGEVYIGSTTRTFMERWQQHRKDLLANKHVNKTLQQWYHGGSMSCLLFLPLEAYQRVPETIKERELLYIKHYGGANARGG